MSVGAESSRARHGQRGFALLVTLLVLVIGAATVFISARSTSGDGAREQASSRLLADAHRAVNTYAQFGGTNNKPGALPCPDTSEPDDAGNAGVAGSHCQGTPDPVYLGRMPWRTVDLPDDSGHTGPGIWYAIDGDYQDHTQPGALNAESAAGLTLLGAGLPGTGQPRVAVLIVPGPALAGQEGRPGTDVEDYLEGENADGDTTFRDCSDVADCNDRVIGITRDQLFDRVQRRVVDGIARALDNAEERLGHLPWASAFGDSTMSCEPDLTRGRLARNPGGCAGSEPWLRDEDFDGGDAWITDNAWDELVVYEVDPDCGEGGTGCGTGDLTLNGEANYDAILAAAGRPHPDQSRPGADVADYLDSETNRMDDGTYEQLSLTPEDNDVLRGVVIGP
jgi:type II secretory pathway pseudopilin PulG